MTPPTHHYLPPLHPTVDSMATPTKHHVVVVAPPYVDPILTGRKTIDCRFSVTRKPPFGAVCRGDKLWFKIASGPVIAVTRVQRVLYFHSVTSDKLEQMFSDYGRGIHARSKFYREHRRAQYATLVLFGPVRRIIPRSIPKLDQRGWVTLENPVAP